MSKDDKKKSDRMHDFWMQQRSYHLKQAGYANGRFDIIVVTLSATGIISAIEFTSAYPWLLIVSMISFAICIISNLIGQMASMSAHDKDEEFAENQIRKNSGMEYDKCVDEPTVANSIAIITNYLSVILLIVGLGFLIVGATI